MTNRAPKAYSKGEGDILMGTEGNQDMHPANSQPSNTERIETPPVQKQPISAERQARARKAWDAFDEGRELPVDEKRVREEIIKRGLPPIAGGATQQPGAGVPPGGVEDIPPAPPVQPPAPGEPSGEQPTGSENIPPDNDRIDVDSLPENLKEIGRDINKRLGEVGSFLNLKDSEFARFMGISGERRDDMKKNVDEYERTLARMNAGLNRDGKDQTYTEEEINKVKKLLDQARQEFNQAEVLLSKLSQWKEEKAGRSYERKQIEDEIKKVFSNPDLIKELRKGEKKEEQPNLSQFEDLKNLIENELEVSSSSGQNILTFATIISDKDFLVDKKGDPPISSVSRRLLFEWMVEQIIKLPDDTPEKAYELGWYPRSNLETILDIARRRIGDDGKIGIHLRELSYYRQMMHDFNKSLKTGEEYKEFLIRNLSVEGLDFVYEMAGVRSVLSLYEKVNPNRVRQTRKVFGALDEDAINKKVVDLINKKWNEGKGNLKEQGRVLTEWEKERALRMGKIFFAGTQRKAVYSGYGNGSQAWAERVNSDTAEFVTRAMYTWKSIAPRFFGGDKGPKAFMKHVFKDKKDIAEAKGEKGKYDGMLGVSSDTMVQNSINGFDIMSRSSRYNFLFWANQLINLKDNAGADRKMTLLDYINSQVEKIAKEDPEQQDPSWALNLNKNQKKAFSQEVRNVILGQRFYFSSLVMYSNFDSVLKADMWRKRASLMPSTVAMLLPDEMLRTPEEQKMWEAVSDRLFLAEQKRVEEEEGLKETAENDLIEETRHFDAGKNAEVGDPDRQQRYRFVDKFCNDSTDGKEDFTNDEREFVKKLIDRAYEPKIANRLAIANMPHTLIIDDTPTIAWKPRGAGYGQAGLQTSDFIRVLNEQTNSSEAGGKLAGATENPIAFDYEVIHECTEKLAMIVDRDWAKDILEPFITAHVEMSRTKTILTLLPAGMIANRLTNTPTSEIEELYERVRKSNSPSDTRDFLIMLVQNNQLSPEALERARKKTKSSGLWIFLTVVEKWIQLLGLEAVIETFKTNTQELTKPS